MLHSLREVSPTAYKDVKNLSGAFVGTDAEVVICNWGVIGIIFWNRQNHVLVLAKKWTTGFPFLDILGYFKNTHKNLKFGKVRQVSTREFPTKFPDWDLSHSSKFGIFVGIL